MADPIQLGKNGNIGKIDFTKIKAGVKKEELAKNDARLESVFDMVDKNNDGVLNRNELEELQKTLGSLAGEDGNLDNKDVKNFGEQKLSRKDRKAVLEFLNKLDSVTPEDVEKVETKLVDNKQVEVVTFKDGHTEEYYPNGQKITEVAQGNKKTKTTETNGTVTSEVVTENEGEENEIISTTSINNGKKQTVIDNKGDNTTTTINYNGDKKTDEKIVGKNSTTVITYDSEGNPAKEVETKGTTVTTYIYENGQKVLQSVIENKGLDGKETTTTFDSEGNSTQIQNVSNGKITTIKDKDGNVTSNVKTETVNGQELSLQLDKDGNIPGVIVQNGESPAAIAKKFGCSVDELMQLNADQLKGKNQYFEVGSEIKLPNTVGIEKFTKAQEGRKPAETAKAEYARDAQIRRQKAEAQKQKIAQEEAKLKELGLIDHKGAGQKVTGDYWKGNKKTRSVELTKIGNATHGRTICKDKSGKVYVVAHNGVILKETFVKVSAHRQTVVIGNTRYAVGESRQDGHNRKIVYDASGNAHVMSHDNKILKNSYVAQSDYADVVRKDTKTARNATMDTLSEQIDNANEAFEAQMKQDGWAGDVADGVSVIWGSDNRASVVREELAQFKKDIAELKNCKTDSEFKVKFKQKFGIEYNQSAVADYVMHPTSANYKKAFGTNRDIGERVAKYNESQVLGAQVVKTTAEVAIVAGATIATGGLGGVAGVAAVTALTDVAIEGSDRLSSEQGLQAGEMTEILKDAAIDGAVAGATMGVGKVISGGYKVYKASKAVGGVRKALSQGTKAIAKDSSSVSKIANKANKVTLSKKEEVLIDVGADLGVGEGVEVVQNGDVSAEGIAMNSVGLLGAGAKKLSRSKFGQKVKNEVKDAFHSASQKVENAASKVKNEVKDAFHSASQKVEDVAAKAKNEVQSAYSGAKSKVNSAVSEVKEKVLDVKANYAESGSQKTYVLTDKQREKINYLRKIYHSDLDDISYLRREYPQYNDMSNMELRIFFQLDENHAAFVKNRKDLFANGKAKYIERAYWNDSPYELTNNHSAWKMHLYSVDELDYQQMSEVVLPYLNKNKIAHKTLSSTMSPELLSKTAPEQTGKAFTIYPQSKEEMAQIAKDLDKLIRERNLTTNTSHITGDNQLGDSGRLFYRYEYKTGKLKDRIYTPEENRLMHAAYDSNRGEGQYLAHDMTPADDPWLNFDPSDPNAVPGQSSAHVNKPAVNKVYSPNSQERMEMGQISNNINRAKTSKDIANAQAWLNKLPECPQKSRLQAQLNEKARNISYS